MKRKEILFLIAGILIMTVSVFAMDALAGMMAVGSMAIVFPGTPQDKIKQVADNVKMYNLLKQQGTTRILYDSLPVTVNTDMLRFFMGSQNRVFPFSNTGSFGNKLEVGETIVVQFAYFNLLKTTTATGAITIAPVSIATESNIYAGELSMLLGNSQVLKPIRILNFLNNFNKTSKHDQNDIFIFDTFLVIPPLLEYEFDLRIMPGTLIPSTETWDLQMTIEGVGGIINNRNTY